MAQSTVARSAAPADGIRSQSSPAIRVGQRTPHATGHTPAWSRHEAGLAALTVLPHAALWYLRSDDVCGAVPLACSAGLPLGVCAAAGAAAAAAVLGTRLRSALAPMLSVILIVLGAVNGAGFGMRREGRLVMLLALGISAFAAGCLRARFSNECDRVQFTLYHLVGEVAAAFFVHGGLGGFGEVGSASVAYLLCGALLGGAWLAPQVVWGLWVYLFGQEAVTSKPQKGLLRNLWWVLSAAVPLLLALAALVAVPTLLGPLVSQRMCILSPWALMADTTGARTISRQPRSLFYQEPSRARTRAFTGPATSPPLSPQSSVPPLSPSSVLPSPKRV